MKNYLLILLSVFSLSFLISSYAPEIDKNLSLDAQADQEQSIEVALVPEKTSVPETELKELANTPEITTVSARASASSIKTSSPTLQSYIITRITADLVASPTYRDIYRTGSLVYAHNSDNLFGHLKNLRLGAIFALTENGVTTNYRVSDIGHFTKVPYTNSRGVSGENLARCDANYNNCSGVWMGALVNNAIYHDVALMTCDGGRNTPNRLIILADKI